MTDIILDNEQDSIELQASKLVLQSESDKSEVIISISKGNFTLGGDGTDGDLMLRNHSGNLTIALNAERGSLHLGGKNEDGDIVVYNRSSKQSVHIDGSTGDIDTEGDISVKGTITASRPMRIISDLGLKQDVENISDGLAAVSALQGVQYSLKQSSDQTQLGFIAQEVEKVIPTAVEKNEDGLLTLDTHAIVPLLVEAVKELSETVQNQTKLLEKVCINSQNQSE